MEKQSCQLYCPKCEEAVTELHEGYCKNCLEEMKCELYRHNFEYDQWQKLSDAERFKRIKDAVILSL